MSCPAYRKKAAAGVDNCGVEMSGKHAEVWIFGLHAVQSVLEHRIEAVLSLRLHSGRQDKRLDRLRSLAAAAGVAVEHVDTAGLDKLANGLVHQGVAALIKGGSLWQEQDLPGLVESAATPFLLVLDGVQDPHNLGACLRTANAAGVQAVIAPKDRSVGLTPVVRKVACGAAEVTPFIQVGNLGRTLRQLKEQGVWLYGLSDKADDNLYNTDLRGPAALVLGAEGSGLRKLTAELCDFALSIPMMGSVSSLNVSVATGLCLYEVLRQRQP